MFPPSVDRPLLLAIETSCDETACAILDREGHLLSSEIASQIPVHREFGGVVPEVAARNHLVAIRPVVQAALTKTGANFCDVGVVAATRGPGLSSSLLIGLTLAKALAVGLGARFLAVNHLEGHLLSPFFLPARPVTGCVCLVVSGGHTMLVHLRGVGDYEVLGGTVDDAAGEAFDKAGKLLGLPYPGGPEIDRLASRGDPRAFEFPRGLLRSGDFRFSFSGIKTAVRYMLPKLDCTRIADVCASFQAAVVDVLVRKSLAAVEATGTRLLAVSGGVACNSGLRQALSRSCASHGIELVVADPGLCTDNAAMIAFVAYCRLTAGLEPDDAWGADADPNLALTAQ